MNFVAAHERAVPQRLTLTNSFPRYQGGGQIQQAEPRAIPALNLRRVENLPPQELHSAADTKHRHAAASGPADFGGEPTLAQVMQTGCGILAARQQNGMIAIQASKVAHGYHRHSLFMNEGVELIEVTGVGVCDQGKVDLLRVEVSTVLESVLFGQGMADQGDEGDRGDAGTFLQPIRGIA